MLVGGYFYAFGHYTGGGAILDAGSAEYETRSPQVLREMIGEGRLLAAVADTHGGWFVGGDFERIGAVHQPNLAHVLADGSIDALFRPDVPHHDRRRVAPDGKTSTPAVTTSTSSTPAHPATTGSSQPTRSRARPPCFSRRSAGGRSPALRSLRTALG